MAKKQKLELTWIGKENRPKLEPRILIEDTEKSYHASHKVSDNDIFDNMLIRGDNLLALKALEQEYAGKVKCILIDPPYNTGSAFKHYDDGLEHSVWLSLMRDRLEIIHRLLAKDGSLWITIDDDESHYLKVLCDEVFGRFNFVANVVWQKKYSPQNDAKWLSDSHDHILVYAKNKEIWRPNLLPRTVEMDKRYKNPDNDNRGSWKPADLSVKTYLEANNYPIKTPSGRIVNPPESRCWVVSESRLRELISDNRIWFGKTGNNVPALKKFLSEVKDGTTTITVWLYSDVGHNQDAKKEVKNFNNQDVFDTPKPEKLFERILILATNPDDLVLDSFLGSGTTAAVAHKMGRRWIGIELGNHCETHCLPRLKKVIDEKDPGGITKSVNWQGGGGFRYYELGPSLIQEDKWGNPVINKSFDAAMLAKALCKLEGFIYQPNAEFYWQQGFSSETDFIYITTQTMTADMLAKVSDEVGDNSSLLICCSSFRCKADTYPNITLKKIPKAVLKKCEWGKDDYSLAIKNLPEAPVLKEDVENPKPKRKFGKGKYENPKQQEFEL